MTIVLSTPPYQQFYDLNGDPLSGGKVYTYLAGTTTPTATYTDQTGVTPCSNPIILDSAGRAVWWLDNGVSYKYIVKDSLDNTIKTIDTVIPFTVASSSLATIAANTIVGNNTGATIAPIALTAAQVQTLINMPANRNKLINGNFRRWDYNTTYALTTTVAYGSANRWVSNMATSAAGIFNRDTSITAGTGFQYNAKVGRTAASALTGVITLAQAMESVNSIPLAGKDVVISFWAKSGANYSPTSRILRVLVTTGTGTDETSANLVAGSWTGTANVIDQNATLTTTWQRFQYTVTLATTVTQIGVQFRMTPTGTAGADDNFYITGIQLETGTVATPFEDRDETTERMLCARYYYTVSNFVPPGAGWSSPCPRKVSMRTTPTYAGGGAGFTATNNNAETAALSQTTGANQTLTLTAEL